MNVKTLAEIQDVIDAFRMHIDYSRLHPFDDISCLTILLNTIDRNAIKHRMRSEGSYADMVKGLNEITELISKGHIEHRERSKPMDQFTDLDIINFMRNTRNHISDILSIVNVRRNGNRDFVCLNMSDEHNIDEKKAMIVLEANKIAAEKRIPFSIKMSGAL